MADEAAPLGPTAANLHGVPAATAAAGYPRATAFYGEREPEPFYREMIEARRLQVRLRPRRLYAVPLESPPGA